jgi:hypothetical protein
VWTQRLTFAQQLPSWATALRDGKVFNKRNAAIVILVLGGSGALL